MSIHCMKEALLAREAHALLLRQALTKLNTATSSPPSPPRPPATSGRPSHTHYLTVQLGGAAGGQLDCSQTWWCLQETVPPCQQGEGSPNTPSPAQLSYILLKLREEVCTYMELYTLLLELTVK